MFLKASRLNSGLEGAGLDLSIWPDTIAANEETIKPKPTPSLQKQLLFTSELSRSRHCSKREKIRSHATKAWVYPFGMRAIPGSQRLIPDFERQSYSRAFLFPGASESEGSRLNLEQRPQAFDAIRTVLPLWLLADLQHPRRLLSELFGKIGKLDHCSLLGSLELQGCG